MSLQKFTHRDLKLQPPIWKGEVPDSIKHNREDLLLSGRLAEFFWRHRDLIYLGKIIVKQSKKL